MRRTAHISSLGEQLTSECLPHGLNDHQDDPVHCDHSGQAAHPGAHEHKDAHAVQAPVLLPAVAAPGPAGLLHDEARAGHQRVRDVGHLGHVNVNVKGYKETGLS